MVCVTSYRHCLACFVAAILLVSSAGWADDDEGSEPAETEQAGPQVDYDVTLNVPNIEGLRGQIEESSQLISLSDDPPASLSGLRRRVDADSERFDAVMRSRGYYDSEIISRIDTETEPVTVEISVTTGEQYLIAAYDIAYFGGAPAHEAALVDLTDIDVTLGEPAMAEVVVGAESQAVRHLRDNGYPFAASDDRLVLADHADKTIWVQVTITPGPFVRYGPTEITGIDRMEANYFLRRVPWQQGEIYDQSVVDQYRQDLVDSGLFSQVTVKPDEDTDQEVRTVEVAIEEGPPRTVRAGASFSTEDGFEVRFGWQHRNIFGEAELLDLSTTLGLIRQRLDATYRQPGFRRLEQDLVVTGALLNEELEAFRQTGATGSVAIEWPVSEHWTGSMGVAVEFLQIDEEQTGEDDQTVLLVGLPVSYSYDDTDDLLNPTKGFRLLLGATPWTGRIGPVFNVVSSSVGAVETDSQAAVSFLSSQVAASTYYPLDAYDDYVIAVRGRVASVGGEPTQTLPANKRLYAGGAGSVRGYEFQKVGPLDADNNPLGGRSLITVGAELRVRFLDDFGVVPFIDGGGVYDSTVPDFEEEFFWGAGLGVRYYTDFGPLRLDVGVPLNRRKNIDDPFQFYISLGQAF